jgi:excinuclease ABC subunit A
LCKSPADSEAVFASSYVCDRRRGAAGEAGDGVTAGADGRTLYVLDEPTTGLHPADVERLERQLRKLVDAGNTVVTVEHDMQVIAGADWVIDMGPGAGDEGGQVLAAGTPEAIVEVKRSRTGPYLREQLGLVG